MPDEVPNLRVNRRLERRRRERRRRIVALSTFAAVLVVVVLAASGQFGGNSNTSDARGHHDSIGNAAPHTRSATKVTKDPLTLASIHRWIASRKGVNISIALQNLKTGQEWLLNPGARDQTASIVKEDILETRLHQTIAAHEPLSDAEGEEAQQMIEASDNDDASELWDADGEAPGIDAYNARAGLTQTHAGQNGFWGETLTSAADQIKLLRHLIFPNKLLTPAAREYELYLMSNIDPGENWGVTGGVPSHVHVALKNGWVPLTSYSDWEVNSTGWIHGDGRDYLLTILTAHEPDYEPYGVNTVNHLSSIIYAALAPAKN
jgi:beta-lactamase family protein